MYIRDVRMLAKHTGYS